MFQSAPGFAAGRCGRRDVAGASDPRFNPLPALQPGDADRNLRLALVDDVSIRSRLCSREMPARRVQQRAARRVSIRSRLCSREMPAATVIVRSLGVVSIRSRLCSREMHQKTSPPPEVSDVSIRSRLCSREMLRLSGPPRPQVLFQSAPGFAAGRCGKTALESNPMNRFNPLPALQPGDAVPSRFTSYTQQMFQSAPGFAAGRCRHCRRSTHQFLRFQSAPGFAAGRCSMSFASSSGR